MCTPIYATITNVCMRSYVCTYVRMYYIFVYAACMYNCIYVCIVYVYMCVQPQFGACSDRTLALLGYKTPTNKFIIVIGGYLAPLANYFHLV